MSLCAGEKGDAFYILIEGQAGFIMARWFRAICDSEMLWIAFLFRGCRSLLSKMPWSKSSLRCSPCSTFAFSDRMGSMCIRYFSSMEMGRDKQESRNEQQDRKRQG